MPRRALAAATTLGVMLAACSASNGSSPTPGASGGVRQIQVTMTDDLRMNPDQIQVKAGETVEFMVRNEGKIRHEFFLGNEDEQAAHEKEMMEMGAMTQDEENGIFVDPGQTKALRHAFTQAGTAIAGCHETGHYAAGMRAQITVQ